MFFLARFIALLRLYLPALPKLAHCFLLDPEVLLQPPMRQLLARLVQRLLGGPSVLLTAVALSVFRVSRLAVSQYACERSVIVIEVKIELSVLLISLIVELGGLVFPEGRALPDDLEAIQL